MWRSLYKSRHLARGTRATVVSSSVNGQARRSLGISRHVDRWKEPEEEEPDDPIKTRALTPEDMEFFDDLSSDAFIIDQDETTNQAEEKAKEEERARVRDELDARKGRGWTDPWELTDEDWSSRTTFEDLPDWSSDMASRISVERVKIHPDGIPTLGEIAEMSLPSPPPPHPGHASPKHYAAWRKYQQCDYVSKQVAKLAEPRIPFIQKLSTWDEKQDAVDELFESVEFQLKEQEKILGKHPLFGEWVERSLEEYLEKIQSEKDDGEGDGTEATKAVNDKDATPIFMDLTNEDDKDSVVPKILHPLAPHPRDGAGRMVEEWELAAHEGTKRIMLRHCTREIAQILEKNESSRIYVAGRRGVGKTATVAATVAAARKSGYLVLYMPDGDRLSKHGYYVEPNSLNKGMFDIPVLSQEVCEEFLSSHESDLEGMSATKKVRSMFFSDDQIKRMPEDADKDDLSLVGLLKLGKGHPAYAPMCFSTVVRTLMHQLEKPFLLAMDEFNCYYARGHYFHMEYDKHVRDPIPYDQISLFKPAMDAMGLSTTSVDNDEIVEPKTPVAMKKGGIIVGVSGSRAVAGKVTDALTASATQVAAVQGVDCPLHVVDVPRFSAIECEHMLSNYELIGIGRLRFDRGDTVMDDQEVGYLRMVSGGVGQKLLDACIV